MEKVLVTGATSYIGRFVALEFSRRGYYVRALARDPKKLEVTGRFLEPPVKDVVNEVFVGEVTKPETLRGMCDGIDVVFSSIGITRQRDKVTFHDVDYQGNKNILDLALAAKVRKFIFISSLGALSMGHIGNVRARNLFVEELKRSGLGYTVIYPTGFFSDLSEVLRMAQKGRVYLMGDGKNRLNPIHGEDLAKVCVDALGSDEKNIQVGGPETFTHRELAELAFSVLVKTPKITKVPPWVVSSIGKVIRPFSEHYYTLLSFFVEAMRHDFVAPRTGSRHLREYYEELIGVGSGSF